MQTAKQEMEMAIKTRALEFLAIDPKLSRTDAERIAVQDVREEAKEETRLAISYLLFGCPTPHGLPEMAAWNSNLDGPEEEAEDESLIGGDEEE